MPNLVWIGPAGIIIARAILVKFEMKSKVRSWLATVVLGSLLAGIASFGITYAINFLNLHNEDYVAKDLEQKAFHDYPGIRILSKIDEAGWLKIRSAIARAFIDGNGKIDPKISQNLTVASTEYRKNIWRDISAATDQDMMNLYETEFALRLSLLSDGRKSCNALVEYETDGLSAKTENLYQKYIDQLKIARKNGRGRTFDPKILDKKFASEPELYAKMERELPKGEYNAVLNPDKSSPEQVCKAKIDLHEVLKNTDFPLNITRNYFIDLYQ
jgi:hypothetical protein